jgi:hypothetical protein
MSPRTMCSARHVVRNDAVDLLVTVLIGIYVGAYLPDNETRRLEVSGAATSNGRLGDLSGLGGRVTHFKYRSIAHKSFSRRSVVVRRF